MSNFDIKSRHNVETSGFREVIFGTEKPILETELNEMQEIQRHRLREIIKLLIPPEIEGVIMSNHSIDYSTSTKVLTINNAICVIDGIIAKIESVNIENLVDNQSVYVNLWETEVDKDSILYKNSAYDEGRINIVIPNEMLDPRIGKETTRRAIRMVKVLNNRLESLPERKISSMKLGTVTNGVFNITAKERITMGGTNDFTNAEKEKLGNVPTNAKFTDTTYTAGTNVSITGTTISATDTTYTKTSLGLNNVTNDKQMPLAGGTFTGVAVAQNNASYTTKQLRNITLSASNASGGGHGDIWIKYK